MSVFSVTRIERALSTPSQDELLALETPVVGYPMTLYRPNTGRRVNTTTVQRVLSLPGGSCFVETLNSLYRLDSLAAMPPRLHRTGNDW